MRFEFKTTNDITVFQLVIFFQFCSKGNLQDILNFNPNTFPARITNFLSKENFYNLFKCFSFALHKAHNKGVAHNDLKPENVFADEDNEGCLTFYVGDWGGSTDIIG